MKQLGGAHFPHGVLGYWGQEARVVNQDRVLCEHLGVQKGMERYSESWFQASPLCPGRRGSPEYFEGHHPSPDRHQGMRKEEDVAQARSGEPGRMGAGRG